MIFDMDTQFDFDFDNDDFPIHDELSASTDRVPSRVRNSLSDLDGMESSPLIQGTRKRRRKYIVIYKF
jgi:hypothetical protein